MHNKHTRRGVHRRARKEGVIEGGAEELGVREELELTGPVTLTVTIVAETPPPSPPTIVGSPTTTSVPHVPLSTGLGVPTLGSSFAPSTTTASTSLVTSSTAPILASPSTPITTSASAPAKTSTSASIAGSGVGSAADDANVTSVKLSSGAIAGIAIGCLLVLLAAVVIGMRKRTTNNRLRLRGMWASSKALKVGANLETTPYTYQSPAEHAGNLPPSGRMSFIGTQPATVSANREAGNATSPRSISTLGLELPAALPSVYGYGYAIGSAGVVNSPPAVAAVGKLVTVIRSYVPTLPDELSISTGERLEILQVYDDGWAECMNFSGDVGMIPLECFVKGPSKRESRMGMTREETSRKSRRYTSLPR